MRHMRRTEGFTMLEILIVVALIAVMTAMAAPRFVAFQRRQDARDMVQRVAGILGDTRAEAIRKGNNQFLLFDIPGVGRVRWVDDVNNDWQLSPGETSRDIDLTRNLSPTVSRYGAVVGPPPAAGVPEEGALPPGGISFPIDPATAAPAVGFTSRGLPVSIPAGALLVPAGSYYVTDNISQVYAATLLPLGGMRVRGFRPASNDWY
ncbi:MAG: Tfp pilus assembly protein FimT/FimU [Myxococcota bacterium]